MQTDERKVGMVASWKELLTWCNEGVVIMQQVEAKGVPQGFILLRDWLEHTLKGKGITQATQNANGVAIEISEGGDSPLMGEVLQDLALADYYLISPPSEGVRKGVAWVRKVVEALQDGERELVSDPRTRICLDEDALMRDFQCFRITADRRLALSVLVAWYFRLKQTGCPVERLEPVVRKQGVVLPWQRRKRALRALWVPVYLFMLVPITYPLSRCALYQLDRWLCRFLASQGISLGHEPACPQDLPFGSLIAHLWNDFQWIVWIGVGVMVLLWLFNRLWENPRWQEYYLSRKFQSAKSN